MALQMFKVIGDMMVDEDIGPDFWRATSLLLLHLYQEIHLHSMIHFSLSIASHAKSRGLNFDNIMDLMDPRAHLIWIEALAIANDDFGLRPKE